MCSTFPLAREATQLAAEANDVTIDVTTRNLLTSDAGRGYAPRGAREVARYEVPTPFDLEAAPSRTTRVLAYPRLGLQLTS